MNSSVVGVIMAGGSGERFWPLSRRSRPKQLLRLTDPNRMMIEQAVDLMLPLIPKERMFIATSERLQETIRKALPSFPAENIIGEPLKRNTAGCLAYAAAHILARYGGEANDTLMAVTTADHRIGNEENFRDTVRAALGFAQTHDALVTLAIKPDRPETGYGYVEVDASALSTGNQDKVPIQKVVRFREKPNKTDAEAFLAAGHFFWNSGMFFWKLATFVNGLQTHAPIIADAVYAMADALKKYPVDSSGVRAIFESLPDISIDYALMEKSGNVYTAVSAFGWDDIGSWDSLVRFLPADNDQNVTQGDPVLIDCKNVTVFNEPGGENVSVCAIGLEDIVVVNTGDGVLICKKDRAQDVKKAIGILKSKNPKHLE